MRLLQCRMLQMTPLSKVQQRYSAAYMGSTASIPPDGDGIETLPWLANDDIKVHADFKRVLLGGDLQPIQIKRRFGTSYRVVRSRPCRIRLTIHPRKLQPLFSKICTYRPQTCILVNQEALWHKLCGQRDIALPHPPSDSCKTWAGLVNQSISRPCRIWMNQEAMLNKLLWRRVLPFIGLRLKQFLQLFNWIDFMFYSAGSLELKKVSHNATPLTPSPLLNIPAIICPYLPCFNFESSSNTSTAFEHCRVSPHFAGSQRSTPILKRSRR